jgi:sugar lactone lactonase YvrE/thiol-disulfide isomerase/thioredoxin
MSRIVLSFSQSAALPFWFALCILWAGSMPAASAADDPRHPFSRKLEVPEFPKGLEWINSKPLAKEQLKGKFVLLDFWTYCCINCIHTLPELKKLEKAYPKELVVIGVHSAKFETEKDGKNLTEAVLRYEIEHPVINDHEHEVWNLYGIQSWPTVILIDPEGNAVWGKSGETKFAEVDKVLKLGLPYYRAKKLLDEKPLVFDLAAATAVKTPLRFPGKVLADEASGRIFIADSTHNRLVYATLEGKLLGVIGSGQIGKADGEFAKASFNKPQGLALKGETLYVADTENHMIRKVDLEKKTVTTIAGTGQQTNDPFPGTPGRYVGKPKGTALGSPWDLWIHEKDLFIAMAGPHQIWKLKLDESEIGPYAGNAREDIVDGPLMPRTPYQAGYASFAQPSGLASDGKWLFVADSEGSSIRRVPLDPKKEVETVVGSNELPFNRLFTFGDVDGDRATARLQHALGVVFVKGDLYVADTYNNKIKHVDPKSGAVRTIAGTGKPGRDDGEGTFDEPAGISYANGLLYVADTNNHLIRTVDPKSGKVGTFQIAGLSPPGVAKAPRKPTFPGAAQVRVPAGAVKPAGGKIKFAVDIKLPPGWKVNADAPASYYPEAPGESGPIDRAAVGNVVKLDKPAVAFEFELPAKSNGDDTVKVSLNYYYCQAGDDGVCKVGAVVFTVPLTISPDGKAETIKLRHTATD